MRKIFLFLCLFGLLAQGSVSPMRRREDGTYSSGLTSLLFGGCLGAFFATAKSFEVCDLQDDDGAADLPEDDGICAGPVFDYEEVLDPDQRCFPVDDKGNPDSFSVNKFCISGCELNCDPSQCDPTDDECMERIFISCSELGANSQCVDRCLRFFTDGLVAGWNVCKGGWEFTLRKPEGLLEGFSPRYYERMRKKILRKLRKLARKRKSGQDGRWKHTRSGK